MLEGPRTTASTSVKKLNYNYGDVCRGEVVIDPTRVRVGGLEYAQR